MNTLQALAIVVLIASGVGPPAHPADHGRETALALEEAWPLVAVLAFVVPLLAALEIARRRR